MFSTQYKLGPELGSGRFGKVVQATDLQENKMVAVKFVERADVNQCVNKEIFALQTIPSHPNIIQLKSVTRDVCFDNKMHTAMVLQLGANGEMFRHIEKYGNFGEEIARTYFRQLLLALKASHAANVYHRDVKLDNIVLGVNFELLLCDWGLSCYCTESTTYSTPNLGTASYLAPELFDRRLYCPAKADLWAATCVLFSLYMGGPPFGVASGKDWHFRAVSTNKKKFWESHQRRAPWATDSFKSFIESVFTRKEAERPSVDEMLNDAWMAGPTLSDGELIYVMTMRTGHEAP
jgi:serine/threonine protein kinase